MSNPRLTALLIAKSIVEEFSCADTADVAMIEVVAAAQLVNAFLEGKDIQFSDYIEDEDYIDGEDELDEESEAVH
jgi:hypothetical protein